MYAAKEGRSTIGIPQSVGAEFAQADEGGKLPARVPNTYEKLKRAMMSSASPARRY
jgi:hypothetical protein